MGRMGVMRGGAGDQAYLKGGQNAQGSPGGGGKGEGCCCLGGVWKGEGVRGQGIGYRVQYRAQNRGSRVPGAGYRMLLLLRCMRAHMRGLGVQGAAVAEVHEGPHVGVHVAGSSRPPFPHPPPAAAAAAVANRPLL